MFEKIKRKTCVQRVFMFIFTEFIYKDFINRDFVFSIFTTLYRIGNIVINILQLCVFALDTQYSLNQVCVVSLTDNLVRTQVEIISDPNYLVRILFER